MTASGRRYIPMLATLGNLAAGCVAIAVLMGDGERRFDLAALLIIAAVLCDSMDGALARMFDAASDFGAELDSLADVVSFGVAPAMLVLSLESSKLGALGWVFAVFFAICAAWRLGRYNVHRMRSSSHGSFCGLPTTGAGGCIASAVLLQGFLAEHGIELAGALLPWLLLALAYLMVSNLAYPHVGGLIARWPVATIVTAIGILSVGVSFGAYEVVFCVFFMAYAFSGPIVTAGAKVKALREAHSG